MPRVSAAAMSVVQIEPGQRRPEPPTYLSRAAQYEWRRIVDSLPPDWFPVHTHPMLIQLCQLICRCKTIADTLDKAQRIGADFSQRQYQNLMRCEMQLSMTIGNLSTRMRLSQQSSVNHDDAQRKRTGKAEIPWEDEAEANNNIDFEEERDAG